MPEPIGPDRCPGTRVDEAPVCDLCGDVMTEWGPEGEHVGVVAALDAARAEVQRLRDLVDKNLRDYRWHVEQEAAAKIEARAALYDQDRAVVLERNEARAALARVEAERDRLAAEVQRYRSSCGEALCGDVEADRDALAQVLERRVADVDRLTAELEQVTEWWKSEQALRRDVDAQRDELAAANARLQHRLATEANEARAALGRVEALCADFDANGNSRELGDPTAETWHKAARLIRAAIAGPEPAPERCWCRGMRPRWPHRCPEPDAGPAQ